MSMTTTTNNINNNDNNRFCGTPGTARYYEERGVAVKILNKPAGATHSIASDFVQGAPEVDEYLREGSVDLVINIPEG
jgi:hypothetical protein